jgi:chemotaxis protein MotB
MAGLLMVFALILVVALYQYQSGLEEIREFRRGRQNIVTGLKELENDSGGIGGLVQVDQDGIVRLGDQLLFATDSATLRPEGRVQLQSLAVRYLRILLGNEQLMGIVIEGHTDDVIPAGMTSDEGYMYNLDLSQRRAFAVMSVLLEVVSDDLRGNLRTLVSANGRANAVPVEPTGEGLGADRAASRRIEIRFQLESDKILTDILERVFPGDE